MGDRKGQESGFINEAREFDYSPFLNANLSFASPFIRTPLRSNYTERKWSERAGGSVLFFFFFHFFGDEERRYRQEQFS